MQYIVCFLGGSSIGKSSKKFGIPKMTLSGKVNNRCLNKKYCRMTEVTEGEEKRLKFCIKYQFCFHQPPIIQTRCEIICLEYCLKKRVT